MTRFSRIFGAHRIGFGADGNYQGSGGTENTFIQDGYFPKPVTYEDALQYEAGIRYTGIERLSVALSYYNY